MPQVENVPLPVIGFIFPARSRTCQQDGKTTTAGEKLTKVAALEKLTRNITSKCFFLDEQKTVAGTGFGVAASFVTSNLGSSFRLRSELGFSLSSPVAFS